MKDKLDSLISSIEWYKRVIEVTLASAKETRYSYILDITKLLSKDIRHDFHSMGSDCMKRWTKEEWESAEIFKWLKENKIKYNVVDSNDIRLSKNDDLDDAICEFFENIILKFVNKEDLITTKLRWIGR